MLPEQIRKFIDLFAKLPSIGPRQATRIAFHIIKQGDASIDELAKAVNRLSDIKTCAQCFFPFEIYEKFHKESLCKICSSRERRQDIVAIVEKETDLISIEKAKKFNGRYLLLGELSKEGILDSAQKLRLNSLKSTLSKQFGKAHEIVIALNPTTLGDIEASLILQELKPFAHKITRLGRGLPTGGEIEFADEDTLGGALENRR